MPASGWARTEYSFETLYIDYSLSTSLLILILIIIFLVGIILLEPLVPVHDLVDLELKLPHPKLEVGELNQQLAPIEF